MEDILRTLQNSPYSWIILSLITIISLGFSVYIWIISKRYKKLTYTKKTNRLASFYKFKPEAIQLLYDGREISDLAITRIALWNSGNEVIKASDLVSEQLITIKADNQEKEDFSFSLLDCSIAFETERTNKFRLELETKDTAPETSSVLPIITFDYVEQKDGIIIQLVHTGSAQSIYLDGHIMGGDGINEINLDGTEYIELKPTSIRFKFLKLLSLNGSVRRPTKLMNELLYLLLILCVSSVWCLIFINVNKNLIIPVIIILIATYAKLIHMVFIGRHSIPEKLRKEL